MNHLDPAYLGRPQGTTITSPREEILLSFADYFSGNPRQWLLLVLGNLLVSPILPSWLLFIMLSNISLDTLLHTYHYHH